MSDWEQRKLIECVDDIGTGKSTFKSGREKSPQYTYPVLGSTNVISYDQTYDHSGNFILTARVGANAGRLYIYQGKVKISDNTVYIQTDNRNFIYNLLLKFNLKKLSYGTGQPLIKSSELKQLKIWTPDSNEEQISIGEFLMHIEGVITLHQRKINILRKLKQQYLKLIFPQNNKNTPELRFIRFKDAWKQDKLKSISHLSKGKLYSKKDLIDKGTQIILYGQMYTNYQTEINSSNTYVDPKPNSIYSKGNEVILPASGESAEDISIASAITSPHIIIGSDLNIIHPESFIHNTFLALNLSHGDTKKQLSKFAQGKSIVHLHGNDFRNLVISFPTLNEQLKISDFISRIENFIEAYENKINKLEDLKRVYLHKMFL